ncbi:MAG TPA: uracil-DNA glycosylase family protein [Longimicrobiales bacterium]|nr:uracil-DNA glycosylase family protein [Longimicrobiales bacterium]
MKQEELRFAAIFQRLHAHHPNCLKDEWLNQPCRLKNGRPDPRPIAWSRRNGPWRQVPLLWVGAAPGNAGGKGAGNLGAHATRIPFGGDVAGANLDALFGSIGITRNDTFITASLNSLPAAGGGEPTFAELAAPVGDYASSLHSLRDTVLACGPQLIVALGNVGLRALVAAAQLEDAGLVLPTQRKLEKAGFARHAAIDWPLLTAPDQAFMREWQQRWSRALPCVLWLTHPSAQNMSPYAGVHTLFHTRMLEARAALRTAVKEKLGWKLPRTRAPYPTTGIYALKEWTGLVGPRHEKLDALWREKGV